MTSTTPPKTTPLTMEEFLARERAADVEAIAAKLKEVAALRRKWDIPTNCTCPNCGKRNRGA